MKRFRKPAFFALAAVTAAIASAISGCTNTAKVLILNFTGQNIAVTLQGGTRIVLRKDTYRFLDDIAYDGKNIDFEAILVPVVAGQNDQPHVAESKDSSRDLTIFSVSR